MKKIFLFIFLLMITFSQSYAEEKSNDKKPKKFRQGWYMTCDFRYDTFSSDLDNLKNGIGANLNLGYASNGHFSFQGGLLLNSSHDFKKNNYFWLSDGYSYKYFNNFKFSGIVIDFKYYLTKPGTIFPYIKAGGGIYSLEGEQNYGLGGTGLQFGGGIEEYISKNFLIQFGLMHRMVTYDIAVFNGKNGKLNNALKANTTSIEIGIIYRFGN